MPHILPDDNDDDMMEVLPYNSNKDNIDEEGSFKVTTSVKPDISPGVDSDYDMQDVESPEQIIATTTNNNDNNDKKRHEDDDYDF